MRRNAGESRTTWELGGNLGDDGEGEEALILCAGTQSLYCVIISKLRTT